jgi:hypothetical protein
MGATVVILFIVVYGFVVPFLISMPNDFLAIIGSLLVIFFPIATIFYIIWFLIKNLKIKKGE